MKKVINFGKIDFYGRGRKINEVTIEVELNETKEGKPVFTASGEVWNSKKTDIVCGGQCLDDIERYFKNNKTFKTIFRLWKLYHLNDMHAGTVKQEEALKTANVSNDYKTEVDYLKKINLYYDNGYKYGSSWLYEPIPENDLKIIKDLLK